jgi:hypothetical protein
MKVQEINTESLITALNETGEAKLSEHAITEPVEQPNESEGEDLRTEPQGLRMIDYSEKAFAIVGDTKNCKAQLKKLGGRYNPKLLCGKGWIFSKKRGKEVATALGLC